MVLLLIFDHLNRYAKAGELQKEMTSEARLIKVGPTQVPTYYHSSPQIFDLKGHKEISQIFLTAGQNGITSIQFQYVENGKYVLSDLYGSYHNINQFRTIELNHPAEYITGIKGLYSPSHSENIQMITFTTNIQEYAPFGLTIPNLQSQSVSSRNFTYKLGMSDQFGGFYGTYRPAALVSIGFYLSVKTMPSNSGLKIPKKVA